MRTPCFLWSRKLSFLSIVRGNSYAYIYIYSCIIFCILEFLWVCIHIIIFIHMFIHVYIYIYTFHSSIRSQVKKHARQSIVVCFLSFIPAIWMLCTNDLFISELVSWSGWEEWTLQWRRNCKTRQSRLTFCIRLFGASILLMEEIRLTTWDV